MTTMPQVRLDAADAAELADMLQFLSDWLAADHGRLAASLRAFTPSLGYDLSQLRRDWTGSSSCSAAVTANPCSEAAAMAGEE